jgi:hypothetical protein
MQLPNSEIKKRRERFEEIGNQLVGQECIIRDSGSIVHARLLSIDPYETDHEGGSGVLVHMHSPGFQQWPFSESSIGGMWDTFHYDLDKWHVNYVNTNVYFHPLLVRNCVRIAAELREIDWPERRAALMKEITRFDEIRNRNWCLKHIPELFEEEEDRVHLASIPDKYE